MKKLILLFIPLLIMISCNDDPPSSTPVYDPEMTADISGEIEILFESQTFVTEASDSGRYVVQLASPMETDSLKYYMTLYIYFKNSEISGVFPIIDIDEKKQNEDVDYAIATFSTFLDGKARETYISKSGSVNITSIIGSRITGSYNFEAESTEGLKVKADNGVLDIYN